MGDVELIDKYLDGGLYATEKADFERRLANDAAFAEEFVWQKTMREVIVEHAGVQSIMRRLEADGHFEKPVIVPPDELGSIAISQKNYWLTITFLLLLTGLAGWHYKEQIKKIFSPSKPDSPQAVQFPSPETDPLLFKTDTFAIVMPFRAPVATKIKSEAKRLYKASFERDDNLSGGKPSPQDTFSMAEYLVKHGDISSAMRLFQLIAADSTNSKAPWASERLGRLSFNREQYREAFQYFEKLASDTMANSDFRQVTEWRMLLCCILDWQHLEQQAYPLFERIISNNQRFKSDALKLKKILQAKGLWRK